MNKRFYLILMLLFLFGSITYGEEDITILFNANMIDSKYSPLKTDGDFMMPISDIFNKIGIQYNIDPSNNIITAYHNNMFLKYYVGSTTYYLNGKGFYTPNAPFISEDIIYLPLSTITNALNISSEYDEEQHLLKLNNYSIKIYKTYTNYFYRNVEIPKFNVSFDIPYYWELLDDVSQTYGFQSDFENSQVTCYAMNSTEGMTLDAYVKNLDVYIRSLYPMGLMTNLAKDEYISSGLKGIYSSFSHIYRDEGIVLGYYVTEAEDVFYVFTFTYNQEDSSYMDVIVSNIIESFEVKSFAIDPGEEHYIEYPKYFSLNMKLSDEYYSNQQFEDYLFFRGSLDPSIDHLNVTVSKNQETLAFTIPVVEGVYEGKIYLPFGLGKHNLHVSVDSDSPTEEMFSSDRVDLIVESNTLMRFSVINISPSFIRYTIPDPGIISDHRNLQSMAYFLTYDLPTDYAKAYAVYQYVMDNIIVRKNLNDSDPYEVYLNLRGSNAGVTFYYASLLRSIGIPTRVYRGEKLDEHYWTEVYLNGSWSVVDPASGISVSSSGDSDDYFLIRPESYRLQYEMIEELTK